MVMGSIGTYKVKAGCWPYTILYQRRDGSVPAEASSPEQKKGRA